MLITDGASVTRDHVDEARKGCIGTSDFAISTSTIGTTRQYSGDNDASPPNTSLVVFNEADADHCRGFHSDRDRLVR